jgi:hypothetical protein
MEMKDKTLFVVSPFFELIQQQAARSKEIWGEKSVLPDVKIEGVSFPFMTDDSCNLDWRDVYKKICQKMEATDFDICLTGCGALGLPLAVHAKGMGKVGIHLGGMLQILFGIKGKRYEQAENYAALMNEFWVSPTEEMRPKNFSTIEDGCYW